MSALFVVVLLLACWRVARFLALDELSRPAREWLIGKVGEQSQLAYLISCPWCISFWSSIPLVWLAIVHQDQLAAQVIMLALAGSLVAGLGQTIEDRLDR